MSARPTTTSSPANRSQTAKAASVPAMKQGPEEVSAAKQQSPTAVQPVEPEDAYLTGVSRSLQRRLLGLNVDGPQGQAKPHPEATAAGLHATGSHSADQGVKPNPPAKTRSGNNRMRK